MLLFSLTWPDLMKPNSDCRISRDVGNYVFNRVAKRLDIFLRAKRYKVQQMWMGSDLTGSGTSRRAIQMRWINPQVSFRSGIDRIEDWYSPKIPLCVSVYTFCNFPPPRATWTLSAWRSRARAPSRRFRGINDGTGHFCAASLSSKCLLHNCPNCPPICRTTEWKKSSYVAWWKFFLLFYI